MLTDAFDSCTTVIYMRTNSIKLIFQLLVIQCLQMHLILVPQSYTWEETASNGRFLTQIYTFLSSFFSHAKPYTFSDGGSSADLISGSPSALFGLREMCAFLAGYNIKCWHMKRRSKNTETYKMYYVKTNAKMNKW